MAGFDYRSRSRSDLSSGCGLISSFSYINLFFNLVQFVVESFIALVLLKEWPWRFVLIYQEICGSSYDLLAPKLVMFLGVGVVVNAFLSLLLISFSCR